MISTSDSSRIARLRASHSYGRVLELVVATFFVAALAPDDAWAGSALAVMLGVTLAVALWTSGVAPASSRRVRVLIIAAAAAAVANVLVGGRPAAGAVAIFSAVLTVAIAAVIAAGVVDQGEVNLDSVRGATAAYLLLGLIFVFAYGAIAALGSSPFFAQGLDGTRSLRFYFSFVTLATLGYGDYTPAGTLGHTLAVVEALLGQLYLVTVVALLVSRLRDRRSTDDRSSVIPPG